MGGVTASSPLQSIDYAYNIRGWMTRINDPASLNGKLFGYELKYNDPQNASASGKYNGSISEMSWKTPVDGVYRRYNYTYDPMNRLLLGKYAEPYNSVTSTNYFNEELSYDANGNIRTLKRFSRPSSGTIAEKIDDLVYNYENNNLSNRLANISLPAGVANNASGYNALGYTIGYDDNGNMTSQPDKGISGIQYNFLNLADAMNTQQGNLTYLYNADGTKLRKTSATKTVDYLNGFQYETTQGATSLKFVPTAEGYYNFENNKYIYSYTDHLGNIHLSYFNNGSGAEVLEENNYYPFGLKHEGYNVLAGNSAYQYKYNGVELQEESGMYAMDWRQYMPDLGRFSAMDLLSESYIDSTPYHFGLNNPITFSDPMGMYTNTHNGYLFTNTEEIAALQKYFGESGGSVSSLGGFMRGNETFKEDIPELVIPAFNGSGTHYNWGQAFQNAFNSYMNSWNTNNFNNYIKHVMSQIGSSTSGNYVRATPDNPFANPSSQLAYNGLVAMQMSASGIATEFVAARTGLTFLSAFGGQGISLSTTGSNAGISLQSLGVQSSFFGANAEAIINNPNIITGQSYMNVWNSVNSENTGSWFNGTMNKSSRASGWTYRQLNSRGTGVTDKYLQFHPGTPRHFGGNPYWKVSSGSSGVSKFPALKY